MNAPAVIERETERAVAPVSEGTAILAMIERFARDPAVDIEKIERLMAMRDRLDAQNAKRAYLTALAEVQPDLPVIGRKGRIEVREKTSSGKRDGDVQQSTTYAKWEDINEAITPIISQRGFSLSFRTGSSADGKITVTGILGHSAGHEEQTTVVLAHDSTGSKNAVQAVGSSISYGKRYAATLLLNLTSRGEDDDGKSADPPEFITEAQAAEIRHLIEETSAQTEKFCAFYKIDSVPELPASRFKDAVDALSARKRQRK